MKNLQEKKRLARMARNAGMPDLALEESIRREEELETLVEAPKPKVIPPKNLVDDPRSASGKSLVDQAAEAIHAGPKQTSSSIPEKLIYDDIASLKKQMSDLVARGTLSWGGGGTGVVRFVDLDDHQHPRDIRYLEFHPE